MTLEELLAACSGEGEAVFVVPAPNQRPPSLLFGRVGPRVEVVCVNANNEAVVRVKKAAVRKFLARNNVE